MINSYIFICCIDAVIIVSVQIDQFRSNLDLPGIMFLFCFYSYFLTEINSRKNVEGFVCELRFLHNAPAGQHCIKQAIIQLWFWCLQVLLLLINYILILQLDVLPRRPYRFEYPCRVALYYAAYCIALGFLSICLVIVRQLIYLISQLFFFYF